MTLCSYVAFDLNSLLMSHSHHWHDMTIHVTTTFKINIEFNTIRSNSEPTYLLTFSLSFKKKFNFIRRKWIVILFYKFNDSWNGFVVIVSPSLYRVSEREKWERNREEEEKIFIHKNWLFLIVAWLRGKKKKNYKGVLWKILNEF